MEKGSLAVLDEEKKEKRKEGRTFHRPRPRNDPKDDGGRKVKAKSLYGKKISFFSLSLTLHRGEKSAKLASAVGPTRLSQRNKVHFGVPGHVHAALLS